MSEISRFFRLEFFKRQGFPTKMDGIAFIEATPALKKEMAKLHMEIEEFKEEKIDEFEQRFEKYEKEKKMFLLNVKEKIRERKEVKKEVQKQALREELRAELMKEMEEEKDAHIVKENKDMFPVYNKENLVDVINIDKKFTFAIKNRDNLSKKQIEELKVMKAETEKAMAMLAKINDKLDKYV